MATEINWDDFSQRTLYRNLALVAEGREFWVSREALAQSSAVFQKMFYGEFREKSEEKIQLKWKKADEFLEFLRCLFPTDGKVKPVNYANVNFLLALADEFETKYVTERCRRFLLARIEKLDEGNKNFIMILVAGVKYKLKDVVRRALPACARLEYSQFVEPLKEFPAEVKMALLLQIISHSKPHRFVNLEIGFDYSYNCGHSSISKYRNRCEICAYAICERCSGKQIKLPRCSICASCKHRTVAGMAGKWSGKSLCRCLNDLAKAELEKVGL